MSRIGVILAGGMGTRLAKPSPKFASSERTPLKPWVTLGEKTLLQHAYDRLVPQVEEVIFSVANDFEDAALLGCKVIPDITTNPLQKAQTPSTSRVKAGGGPLVAIASALQCLHKQEGCTEMVTVPVDMPFLPATFVAQLAAPLRDPDQPCYAFCGGRDYPTCAIWPISLAPQLVDWVGAQDMRAIYKALGRCGALKVDFDTEQSNAFLNINSPQDFEKAKTLIETGFGDS